MAIDPLLITTKRVGELPVGAFETTDKIPHEKGVDLYQGTLADLIAFISPLVSAMQYEVKTFHVNQAFIDANFILTGGTAGLGINLMTGFAIVNGNNGTINKDGRTGIAYGAVTNVIGQVGGSKDSVLVAHTHTTRASSGSPVLHNASSNFYNQGETWSNSGVIDLKSSGIESAGESGVGKNMQPYLVELQVMKL